MTWPITIGFLKRFNEYTDLTSCEKTVVISEVWCILRSIGKHLQNAIVSNDFPELRSTLKQMQADFNIRFSYITNEHAENYDNIFLVSTFFRPLNQSILKCARTGICRTRFEALFSWALEISPPFVLQLLDFVVLGLVADASQPLVIAMLSQCLFHLPLNLVLRLTQPTLDRSHRKIVLEKTTWNHFVVHLMFTV